MISLKQLSVIAFIALTTSCTSVNATNITKTDHKEAQNFYYSSFYSSDSSDVTMSSESSSSFFFNDSMDRLTYFEVTAKGNIMTLTIRQNMNIVWKKSYTVKNNHFSVKRIDSNGHISFRIVVGEHILSGVINKDDKWVVTEVKTPISMKDETLSTT